MTEGISSVAELALVRGRDAAARSDWAEAYVALATADGGAVLTAADLELLATAAYLMGRVRDSIGALQRALQVHLERDDVDQGVRCAFWLGFHLINSGEFGQAGGLLARVGRVVDELGEECAAHGYVLLPRAFQQLVMVRDYEGGGEMASRVVDIGRRFDEPDLVALAPQSPGACAHLPG